MSRRLLRSGAVVSLNTLGSRVLGLVRDVVIARLFGASLGVDAFLVAFRLPNFLRRLFAEGAFSQAFVPVLSEYKEKRSFADVQDLTSHVFGALGAVLFAVTLLGVLAAPVLVMIFAPGFLSQADKYEMTVSMVRITFPYLLFISLTSFAGGILNSYGRFGVPAFTPVLLNLTLIACALWLAPLMTHPVFALALGVLIAGIVQLAFQLPFIARLHLLRRPRLRLNHPGVKQIVKLIIPAIFGVSVSQINLLVDTLIASFLVTGSVTWLYYSDRMVEFPLGVFGIALATVILPGLSSDHARGSKEAFSRTLDWALRLTLLVCVPAALGLAVLAGPILTTLFHYGAFAALDVRMAASSLVAYSLGLVAFVGIKVLAPGFYARQDTRTPVRIGVIAMFTNMVLNLVLVWPLAHAGLALATSLSAFLNAGLLLAALKKTKVYRPEAGWGRLVLQMLVANTVMVGGLLWGVGAIESWFERTLWERAVRLSVLVGGGAIAYAGILALVGVRLRSLLTR